MSVQLVEQSRKDHVHADGDDDDDDDDDDNGRIVDMNSNSEVDELY